MYMCVCTYIYIYICMHVYDIHNIKTSHKTSFIISTTPYNDIL